MKRILIISQYFYPEIGSASTRLKHLYMMFKKRGFDVTIFTTEPSYPNKNLYQQKEFWDVAELNQENEQIYRVEITNRKYSTSIFNRLFYYLEIAFKFLMLILKDKKKYDYIFVTSPPIFIGLVGLFAKWKYKTKFILDIRDLWPESLKGVGVFNNAFILNFFGILEKLLYRKSDKIVINSMGFRDYIYEKARIEKDKIVFIPNGSMEEDFAQVHEESNKRKIIYAGNLGLAQNTELIHQLAPRLDKLGIQLTIIGYGMNKKSLLSSLKQHKNVVTLNPISRKGCLKIMANHDIGLVTLKDADVFKTVLPGKIIDYMTSGLPVVGIVDGYAKELIQTEGTGIVIDERDPQQILEHIKNLLDNEPLRREMSQKAHKLIHEQFNWENNIDKLINHMG